MTEQQIEKIVLWPMWLFLAIQVSAIVELLLEELLGVHQNRVSQGVKLKIQLTMILLSMWWILLYVV
jgi:hypothetical protein